LAGDVLGCGLARQKTDKFDETRVGRIGIPVERNRGIRDRSLGCDLVPVDMPLPFPRHGELPPAPPGQPVRWRGVMILGAWW
jgi:hypothetical protein